jgi:asparagine synthase (glutamine-hydrolysing)
MVLVITLEQSLKDMRKMLPLTSSSALRAPMADFILDTRPGSERTTVRNAELLRFSPLLHVAKIERAEFSLVLTWFGEPGLWSPRKAPDGSFYAVVGMVALDESEWQAAEQGGGSDGLAARAIARRFETDGSAALEDISGNCVIVIHDAPRGKLYLRTDPAGALPVYSCECSGMPVWGSHPDVLAAVAGETGRADAVSLAEFILASTVTPPFTYYERIRAVEPGTLIVFDLPEKRQSQRRYFTFDFQGDPKTPEDELADVLAVAWRQAVRRRTLPRFGRPVVALSGGLDSRLILAAMSQPERALAFTCYDAPNRELQYARSIARAVGAAFLPLQRSPDYYGENAEAGVRISGGMGTFANNHFLGVLERLHAEGLQTMLTGCYCDYLFKALPLNRRIHWFSGRETVAPFADAFYFSRWIPDTPLATQVLQRWEDRFPAALRERQDDATLFEVEVRRTFPLSYEGDNQQRLVPQRMTGWCPPLVDLELLRVYRRIPPSMKLNRGLFLKAARRVLAGSPAGRVPDANTGARLSASPLEVALFSNWLRIRRRLRAVRRSLASDEAWPDWHYYYRHSPVLERLWMRPHPEAEEFFLRVLGWSQLPARPADFPSHQVFLFVAMLTQKLWWLQLPCFGDPSSCSSA